MVCQAHKRYGCTCGAFQEARADGAVLDGSEIVGHVEAEVDVVVGCLSGGSKFCCQVDVRAGSSAEVPEYDGWLEGFEELHNERAPDDLGEVSWSAMERTPGWPPRGTGLLSGMVGNCVQPAAVGVVEDAVGPHLAPFNEGVQSVVRPWTGLLLPWPCRGWWRRAAWLCVSVMH